MPRSSHGPSPESGGLKDELTSLARETGGYLRARSELASLEAQEALYWLKRRFRLLIIGLMIALPGYLSLTAAIIGWLAGSLSSWMSAACIVAIPHLIIGAIFVLKARRRPSTPFFEYSRREWQNDRAWIQENNNSSSS